MIGEFEFKGDWETKIILKEFSQLNHSDYRRYDQDVENGIFNMTIEDEQNCNPYPEEEQLNAINFLISNQKILLDSIYDYILNTVYPEYKIFQSPAEYPECYPTLNSSNDLQKLLGINEIIITRHKKENQAYTIIGFNTCLDHEHGLYIVFHKVSPLIWAAMGDLSYDKIFEEGGNTNYAGSYNKYGIAAEKYNVHLPDPSLGKLKPWQRQANERRVNELINQEPQLFKKLINNKIISSNSKLNYSTAFELCVKNRNLELIEYLINDGSKFDKSLLYAVGNKFDKELLELLVQRGANINDPIYKDKTSTILYKEIYDLAQLYFHKKDDKTDSIQRIKQIISLGGDPNNCNGEGKNYEEMLKERYSESFINSMNLQSVIGN